MANQEQLKILKQGVEAWYNWRSDNPDTHCDLSGADLGRANLNGADLYGVDLGRVDLSGARLKEAELGRANLGGADLSRTDLNGAELGRADLRAADLNGAELGRANLGEANLREANLAEADFSGTRLWETVFGNVDLSKTDGLDSCQHLGPSIVDHRTLELSKNVPINFWRGCGLPDRLIDYLPSLTGDSIQFYSCFISYSSKDQEFANRLHADLQNAGVRCWFAPHDLPIGEKIWDGLDEAIRLRDKVLLILSQGAIASDWVEDEVATAFEEERRRKGTMLFPVRLDDVVMETDEPWASKLRSRSIGDFTRWKNHDAYKATFDRVLRDLRAER